MGRHSFDSVIFDLDGVVTRTANVHAKAWKTVFDDYLRASAKAGGEPFREFSYEADYLPYVDGKPRYQGVKSFLESRGISLAFGSPSDKPGTETICGIGNRKNTLFNEILQKDGAEVFPSTVKLIQDLKKEGIKVGVASSSKNCRAILASVGFEDLFDTRVDGIVSEELGLIGKPAGDIFVTAARNVKADPARSVVVEDATAGVEAGKNGGFGMVIGVARQDNAQDLLAHGADIAVRDLAEVTIASIDQWFQSRTS